MAIVRNRKAFIKGEGLSIYSPICPNCGKAIQAQAQVERFMEPAKWLFYGKQGGRVKVCHNFHIGFEFVHFAVKLGGGVSHRLAWVEDYNA